MDTTNELQQSLLDTMDLISTKIAKGTNAPLTIKAEIVEELDSGLHQYSISYGGAIYKDAYAIGNVTYDPSTVVFVLIPDNDFDNPKMILNAVTPSASEFAEEELTEIYVPINDNLLVAFGEISLDLQSWEDKEYDPIPKPEEGKEEEPNATFNTAFKDYLNKYRTIAFEAEIMTEIDREHQTKGNYGLKLILPFIQRDDSIKKEEGDYSPAYKKINKEFYMDVTNMLGNPYNYNVYQKTRLYFEIDNSLEYDETGIAKIVPFTKDFGYITKPKDKESDIHIRNVSLQMVDVVSVEQVQGYYMTIESDSGHYFLNTEYNSPKTLTPILRVNGKKTNCSSYDCYWFVRDMSINYSTSQTEGYNQRYGGSGWRCLNKVTSVVTNEVTGEKSVEYKTNDYQLVVNPDDVESSLEYKCVLVKGEIKINNTITIKNLDKPIDISLKTTRGITTYIEKVGNVELIAKLVDPNSKKSKTKSYSAKWQLYDKDGILQGTEFFTLDNEITDITENGNTYELDISFPCEKIVKACTVSCTFYMDYLEPEEPKEDEPQKSVHKIVGTASIVLTTVSGLDYIVSIVGGDKIYKYDPQGDSPMIGNYDGPATCKVKACDPLKFRIYKTIDGKELSDSEYLYVSWVWKFPKKNTMLLLNSPSTYDDDDYYYIEGRMGQDAASANLIYKIRETYRKSYTNNIVYLSVSINGEEEINTSTTILFTKDGMGGTNGSRYTAFITNNGYPYNGIDEETNKLRKVEAIYINEDGQKSKKPQGWYQYNVGLNELPQPINSSNGIPFSIMVYKDGEPVITNEEILSDNIDIQWDIFDEKDTQSFFKIKQDSMSKNSVIVIPDTNWTSASARICNILQATVTISEKQEQSSENQSESLITEVLYVYYTIETIRAKNADIIFPFDTITPIIPTFKGGFDEVLYTSSGTTPEWDEGSKIITCVDSVYEENSADLEYKWEVSSNLKDKAVDKEDSSSREITPVTKFESNITNNYVEVSLVLSEKKKEELTNEIKILQTTSEKQNDEIEKLRNIRASILDMVQKIGYNKDKENNNMRGCLQICSELLKYRFQLLTILNQFKEQLNRLQEIYERDIYLQQSTSQTSAPTSNEDAKILFIEENIKSLTSKVNNEYTNIYLLDGENHNINYLTFTLRKNSSNQGKYSYLYNNFIDNWNTLVSKYNHIVADYIVWAGNPGTNIFIRYRNLNILRSGIADTVTYVMDENTPSHKGLLVYTNDQQFVNLGKQLHQEANKVIDVNGGILSYADFENLLNKLVDLIYVYSTNKEESEGVLISTDYIKNICDKQIEEQIQILQDIENKLTSAEATLGVGSGKNDETLLIYVKPILMHMNSTEMSFLRGWDGHKLYTGSKDHENEYIFAPIMGAGGMNDQKQFTGIVMGIQRFGNENQLGLFGKKEGIQTMFLNARDGSAIFGASGGGQIIIDPSQNRGLIYSASYFYDKNNPTYNPYGSDGKPRNYDRVGIGNQGMLINLGNTNINDTPFIHFGDEKGYIYSGGHNELTSSADGFYLNHEGLSIGNTIKISSDIGNTIGKVEVGYLKSGDEHWTIQGAQDAQDGTYSYIGYKANAKNFSTDTDGIISIDKNKAEEYSVYIGTNGIRLGRGFAVDNKGNGFLSGHIEATSGDIGRWKIAAKKLEGKNVSTGEIETKYNKGDLVGIPKGGDYIKNTFARLDPDGDITVMNTGIYGTWKLGHDGIVKVDSAGSIFGGVHITDSKDPGNIKETYYTSQHFKNLKKKGVFHENCFDEIQLISQNEINSLEGNIISVVDDSGAATSYHIVIPKFFDIPTEYYNE